MLIFQNIIQYYNLLIKINEEYSVSKTTTVTWDKIGPPFVFIKVLIQIMYQLICLGEIEKRTGVPLTNTQHLRK